MTVLVRYSPTSLTRETYDRVNEALNRQGLEGPPRELVLHCLFGEEPTLRVSEIWESEEAWRAFRSGPLAKAFTDVGLQMPAPELLPVQAYWGAAIAQSV
jgi:heme-degrading monooxygenase HmoA